MYRKINAVNVRCDKGSFEPVLVTLGGNCRQICHFDHRVASGIYKGDVAHNGVAVGGGWGVHAPGGAESL